MDARTIRHRHNALVIHRVFVKILRSLKSVQKAGFTKTELKEQLASSGGICGLYKHYVKDIPRDVVLELPNGSMPLCETSFPIIAAGSKDFVGKHIVNPNKLGEDVIYYWKPHMFIKKGKLVGIKIRIKFLKGALTQLMEIVNKNTDEETNQKVAQ